MLNLMQHLTSKHPITTGYITKLEKKFLIPAQKLKIS